MDSAQCSFSFKRTQTACKKGETIAEALPYAHVLSHKERGRRCDSCFVCSEKLRKCSACGVLYYCNVACQKRDWALHKQECRCLRHAAPNIPSESVRLLLRLLIRQQRGEDSKMLEDFPGSRTFQDLLSHAAEVQRDETRCVQFAGMQQTLQATVGDILPLPPPPQLLELFGKMVINTISICDDDLQPIGSGLYVSLSRLDHSCRPSACLVFLGTRARLQASQHIPHCTPSSVHISYIEPLATREERQRQLLQQYYFTCHCPRCLDPAQDRLLLSWRSPHLACPGPVFLNPGEAGPECVQCGHTDFPADLSSSASQVLSDVSTALAAAEKLKKEEDWGGVLELCGGCLQQQGEVCGPHNVCLLRTLELAFDACVSLQQWRQALEFGERMAEPYRTVLPWPCPSQALQSLRLGKLQLFLGRLTSALPTLTSALDTLAVTHGKDHPVCTAALQLLHQCQQELHSQQHS